MSSLLYNRQFIVVNREITYSDNWNKDILSNREDTWHIYYHPNLTFTRRNNDGMELILFGYLLDPENPSFGDQDILEDLLNTGSFDKLTRKISNYCGRFVLIYSDQYELRILNDPSGFRELYYCFDRDTISFGSTPNLLAKFLKIEKTKNKEIIAFFKSDEYHKADFTWVGENTLYDNILHLLPNNYLNITTKSVIRFWPDMHLQHIGLDECANECASILKGTIKSAMNRYKIHVGITAGWDTRLLLAATKEFKDKIFYYVNKPNSYADSDKDLRVPMKMAEALGFILNVVDISDEIDEDFKTIFFKNNVLARDLLLPVFYEVYKRNWQDTVTVSGTMGNGLARIYSSIPEGVEISGENVARLSGYQNLPYAVKSLDKWVDEVSGMCKETDIDIMDLFQLEQENAHWASLASSEQDIVREEIRPFNNRKLISLFWSLDNKYRYQYYPIIYNKIIEILWKDLLQFPLNPSRKSHLYKLLRIIGLEQKAYYYYKKRKFIKSMQKTDSVNLQ